MTGTDDPDPPGSREPVPGDTAEVRVESVAAGGAGVARLPGGRVCFVHRTAPGDRARVRITTVKRSWARAELVEVLEPGAGRRPPPCPFYGRCGGCTLEHLTYDAQLDAKARIVTDALERIGHVDHPPVGYVRPSPAAFRYRSRVSFHLRRPGGDRVVAGFHELERPERIVDVDGRCLLPEPELGRCWNELRGAWGAGAHRLPGGRGLRLTLRRVVGGVVLVVEPEGVAAPSPEMGAPAELVDRVDTLRAVWWRPRGAPAGASGAAADAVDAESALPRLLAGDPDAPEEWLGREVRTRSGAFVQVNRPAAVELHEGVLSHVGVPGGSRIVDAYCGVGGYGRWLAREGATVLGIEVDPDAVAAARADAPSGFRVLEGLVEDRLAEALPADLVLLNPPRSGLEDSIPARLGASGVGRVVYVSCDPATLARDLGRMDADYRVAAVEAFDLFPQTAHVEVVAVLERREEAGPKRNDDDAPERTDAAGPEPRDAAGPPADDDVRSPPH